MSRFVLTHILRAPRRWRFAGAERGSRVSQIFLNPQYVRVRAAKNAPRGPYRLLENRHSLVEIAKRRAVVSVKRLRVKPPQN